LTEDQIERIRAVMKLAGKGGPNVTVRLAGNRKYKIGLAQIPDAADANCWHASERSPPWQRPTKL
jgi:hypothetical protein